MKLFEIFICFAENFVIFFTLNKYFTPKHKNILLFMFLFTFAFVADVVLGQSQNFGYITLIAIFISSCLMSIIQLNGKLYSKVIICIVLITILLISNILSISLFSVIRKVSADTVVYDSSIYRVVSLAFSKIVQIILCFLLLITQRKVSINLNFI
jgi:hypothetical protein